jgi:hypothetical protein
MTVICIVIVQMIRSILFVIILSGFRILPSFTFCYSLVAVTTSKQLRVSKTTSPCSLSSRHYYYYPTTTRGRGKFSFIVQQQHFVLSDAYLENDLVAVQVPDKNKKGGTKTASSSPRLCAVKPDGSVAPLCQRQDDVETDLFCDPREFDVLFWQSENDLTDAHVVNGTVFGEGYYGQRPVPSLGGGPGYGASADEIWSVDEELLEKIRAVGVDIPILDMGIAHGEKARAGAF